MAATKYAFDCSHLLHKLRARGSGSGRAAFSGKAVFSGMAADAFAAWPLTQLRRGRCERHGRWTHSRQRRCTMERQCRLRAAMWPLHFFSVVSLAQACIRARRLRSAIFELKASRQCRRTGRRLQLAALVVTRTAAYSPRWQVQQQRHHQCHDHQHQRTAAASVVAATAMNKSLPLSPVQSP